MDPAKDELSLEDLWKELAARLLARLVTTPAGLRAAEAQARLAAVGPNDAATVKRSPLWLQFLSRFRSRRIVDAVAHKADDMAEPLQRQQDPKLLLPSAAPSTEMPTSAACSAG